MGRSIQCASIRLSSKASPRRTRRPKVASASLKSTGTTTSFSSQLKAATEKETTKAVPGQNYAEILTGPRAGMYLNTGGGARDGEAFVLVKHDGREDHIYGTGDDRKVITRRRGQVRRSSDSTRRHRHQDLHVDGLDSTDKAPASEKTKPVDGRAYADILAGPRKGLYLNTSGNARDGKTLRARQEDDREFHIYGTGKDREVFMRQGPGGQGRPTPTTTTTATTTDTADHRRHHATGSLVTTNPTSSADPPRSRGPAGCPPAGPAADRPRAAPTPARA